MRDAATVKKARKIHYWYRCPYPRCTFSNKRLERFKTHIYTHSPNHEETPRVDVPQQASRGPPSLEFMDMSFDVPISHSHSHHVGAGSSMAGHSASASSSAGPSKPRRHNVQPTSVDTSSTMSHFGGSSFPDFGYSGYPSDNPHDFFLSQ